MSIDDQQTKERTQPSDWVWVSRSDVQMILVTFWVKNE